MKPAKRAKKDMARLLVAALALTFAFGITAYRSQGHWQFAWDSTSLLAQPELPEGTYDLSSILVLNRVLLQLQENYVEAERLKPRLMLAAGLEEIGDLVPEIVVSFARPLDDNLTEVSVQVGDEEKTFQIGEIESLWEMSLKFKEIFRFMQQQLSDEVDPKEIEYAAINGLLDTTDPHSVHLSPEVYASMVEENRGNFGGLGIVVRMDEGQLKVIELMGEDTPAAAAGVLPDDIILAINGRVTLNMEISEAVSLLRGEPGTTLDLLIRRSDVDSDKIYTVERAEIQIPSVQSKLLSDHIGYVQLSGFQGNTFSDMVDQLDAMQGKAPLKGLILDLRNNPGGLLEQATKISDYFIDSGTLVTTVGAGRRVRQPYPAHEEDSALDYPIVVLVNSSSASASEIVAGALKNLDRALIVGELSFGKGSVQILYELQDGSALKLTVAQYLTPGDLSIQSVGIAPDIELIPMTVKEDELDVFPRRWIRREATLESHLQHESAVASDSADSIHYLAEESDNYPPEKMDQDLLEDAQISFAHAFLKGSPKTLTRETQIDAIKPTLEALKKNEDKKLVKALADQQIDWTDGPFEEPQLSITGSIKPADPLDTQLDAGDEALLQLAVTNTGSKPVYRLYAITESTASWFDDEELIFGRVDPGQTLTRDIKTTLRDSEASRFDSIKAHIFCAAQDHDPSETLSTHELSTEVLGRERPKFAFSYAVLGSGFAHTEENNQLRIFVENLGESTASDLVVYMRNMNGAAVSLNNARSEIAGLKPKSVQSVFFDYQVEEDEADFLDFELHIYDRELGSPLVGVIQVPVAKAQETKAPKNQEAELSYLSRSSSQARAWPQASAPPLFKVAKGDSLLGHSQNGDFVLVSNGELVGWLPSADLKESPNEPPLTAAPELIEGLSAPMVYTVFPPLIMASTETLTTTAESATITGSIFDDGTVHDYYAIVQNEHDHVYESQKVIYQRADKAQVDFELEIPLAPGQNRIKLIARDNQKLDESAVLYVYRQ